MSYHPTPADLRVLGYTAKDIRHGNFQKGFGCSECAYTGYKGRIAVHEMLILDEAVRDAILEKKTSYQIRNIGIESTGPRDPHGNRNRPGRHGHHHH